MPARRPLPLAASRAPANSTHFALHDRGQVILDRGMDVADVEGHRQPAREGIEVAHVDLALPRHFQLAAELAGELADTTATKMNSVRLTTSCGSVMRKL